MASLLLLLLACVTVLVIVQESQSQSRSRSISRSRHSPVKGTLNSLLLDLHSLQSRSRSISRRRRSRVAGAANSSQLVTANIYRTLTISWDRHTGGQVHSEQLHETVRRLLSERSDAPRLLYEPVRLNASIHLLAYGHIPKCGGGSAFKEVIATVDAARLAVRRGGASVLRGQEEQAAQAGQLRFFPPRTLCMPGDAKCRVRSLVEPEESYLNPGCTGGSGNGVGAHCSHQEIASCIESGLAVYTWKCSTLQDRQRDPEECRHGRQPTRRTGSQPPQQPAPRTPLFVTVLRDPIRRVLSEYSWGAENWCADNLMHDAWNPWPPELCRLIRTSTNSTAVRGVVHPEGPMGTADILRKWTDAPFNPAHNRQAIHLAAPLLAPALADKSNCLFSHTRLSDAYGARLPMAHTSEWDLRAIARDQQTLESAWQTLRTRYLLVGVLGAGHGLEDMVAVFRHMVGLPQVRPSIGLKEATHLAGMLTSRHCDRCSEDGSRGALYAVTQDIAMEIAARNQLDVALFEAVRSELAAALKPLRLES
jgi:hypothetical protein